MYDVHVRRTAFTVVRRDWRGSGKHAVEKAGAYVGFAYPCCQCVQPMSVQCTLNVYGSDAVVLREWKTRHQKAGAYLRYTHRLSFIHIDEDPPPVDFIYLFIYLWIPQRLVYSINLSRGSPCMYLCTNTIGTEIR